MKMQMFVMRDRKMNEYTLPFFYPNKGVMLRDLAEQVQTKGGNLPFQKYPADFELCECGWYETDTGLFESTPPIITLMLSELLVSSS